jgi:DNA (cytosine-5)-methyltransferase 1
MRVASFFAGIGGFDLGFQRAGMEIVFHCEIDEHCQKILKRHWPGVPLHADIKTLDASTIPSAELWCAGWPCQDLSHANATERKGLGGERSGLFHDFFDLVKKVRPTWLVLENVPGLLSAEKGVALETVIDTLEKDGYLGGWLSCNTLDAGLPHNRDRVFIIASYRDDRAYNFFADCGELHGDFAAGEESREKSRSDIQESLERDTPLVVQRRGGFGYTKAKSFSPTIRAQTGGHQGGHSDRPILCGQKLDVDRVRETDGFSRRLDGRRGRLIGNAVSPTVAQWIGRRLVAIETSYTARETSAA